MPLKDPKKRKEYDRLRYMKNKEKINENKKEYNRLYYKTENGRKRKTINQWKSSGVICQDFDKMYEIWFNTNNCDWCHKDVSKKRNLEHNHNSGEIRGIVCNSCNMKMMYKDKNYQKVMKELTQNL